MYLHIVSAVNKATSYTVATIGTTVTVVNWITLLTLFKYVLLSNSFSTSVFQNFNFIGFKNFSLSGVQKNLDLLVYSLLLKLTLGYYSNNRLLHITAGYYGCYNYGYYS